MLQERDEEPPLTFTKERRVLCTTCDTLIYHWDAHKMGTLHMERKARAKRVVEAAAACSASRPLPVSSGLHTVLEEVAVLRGLLARCPDLLTAGARGLVNDVPQECPASPGLPGGSSEFLTTPFKTQRPAATQRDGQAANVNHPRGGP